MKKITFNKTKKLLSNNEFNTFLEIFVLLNDLKYMISITSNKNEFKNNKCIQSCNLFHLPFK